MKPNGGSLVLLLVGAFVGFFAVYLPMRDRAVEIARPLPSFVPTQRGAAPAVDAARLQQLQEIVRNDPGNFGALAELGNLYYDQTNFVEAANWYRRAVEVRPDDIGMRTELGGALFFAGRVDDSIAEFRRSLERNPTHPETLFNLGVALLDGKGDREGAIEVWERLIQTNPGFPHLDRVREEIRIVREMQ